MTRHARNNTAGSVYTYHEKQKDTKSGGYGTRKARIGKDSVKDFDSCCLTLQPCRNPVITPEGHLYDKEAILEYVINQKTAIAKQMKEYQRQKNKDTDDQRLLAEAEQNARTQAFIDAEKNIVNNPGTSKDTQSSISNMSHGKDKKLPSFWIPSLTPDSKKVKLDKPKSAVYCPMSGKPLKIKDLIPVKFDLVKDPDDKASLITKRNRYMCAVTHDILGNSVPCCVLRTSGRVVTVECLDGLIRKDMVDPTNGQKLQERDIIPFQRGGTGYASTNETLDAVVKKPVLQA